MRPLSASVMLCAALLAAGCSDSSAPARPTLSVIPTTPNPPINTPATPGSVVMQDAPTPAPAARYTPTPGMAQMATDALKLTAYGMCKSKSLGADHPAHELAQKLSGLMSGGAPKGNAVMLGQLRAIEADKLKCTSTDTACQAQAHSNASAVLDRMQARTQQGGAPEDVLIEYLGEDKARLCA